MKKLIVSMFLLLSAMFVDAAISNPFGAEITGAGLTEAAGYVKALIQQYNAIFPCPKFVYLQSPKALYAGATNGVNRVLDNSVTFAVTDTVLTDTPNCLAQIPFYMTVPVVIIYNSPSFTPNANWPGHFNISPSDLCTIFTGAGIPNGWNTLGIRAYNGGQNVTNAGIVTVVRADSAVETGFFVKYLQCSNPTPTPGSSCATFLSTVTSNTNYPNGPFCPPSVPQWGGNAGPICSVGDDGVAIQVKASSNSMGYVSLKTAIDFGFIPGSANGFPLGVAGLYNGVGSTNSSANYVVPTIDAIQANLSTAGCFGGLCTPGLYPILSGLQFVIFATQPTNFVACNMAQFIQFVLTEGKKLQFSGFTFNVLPDDCVSKMLEQLSDIRSVVCSPCVEPCNPCSNQTCPLPCPRPCK